MVKIAFVFPGQGSQFVGMGKDFYDHMPTARKLLDEANEILGCDLTSICFNGPEETLKETQYTQPAIFVHSIIVDKFLKEKDIRANAVAGHSLGEFSALVSADVLSFESALEIVKVRSSEMAQAGKNSLGTMAAILGADDDQLKIICKQDGVVVPANINAPGQVVISGEIKAIENAIITAKEIGIRRALALNVSGAFHSPLMAPARQPLLDVIDSIEFNNAKIPVYQNVSASPVINAAVIRDNILNQLENPVLWCDTILNLKQMGDRKSVV